LFLLIRMWFIIIHTFIIMPAYILRVSSPPVEFSIPWRSVTQSQNNKFIKLVFFCHVEFLVNKLYKNTKIVRPGYTIMYIIRIIRFYSLTSLYCLVCGQFQMVPVNYDFQPCVYIIMCAIGIWYIIIIVLWYRKYNQILEGLYFICYFRRYRFLQYFYIALL